MRSHTLDLLFMWFGTLSGLCQCSVIDYTFSCNGVRPYSGNPHDCDTLSLSCREDEVIVATICVGGFYNQRDVTDCSYNETCHASYRDVFPSANPESFVPKVGQCLWKKQSCEIRLPAFKAVFNKPDCTLSDFYNYAVAFDNRCLKASSVHQMCRETPASTAADPVGYIINRGFPEPLHNNQRCNQTFLFSEASWINITNHFMDLEDHDNKDSIVVYSLNENMDPQMEISWTGTATAGESHIMYGNGFVIELCLTSAEGAGVDGFLLSYEATNYSRELTTTPSEGEDETSTHNVMTSSVVVPSERPCLPGGWSQLERAGVALAVLFPLTFITLMVTLLLYIKARIQRETSGQESTSNFYVTSPQKVMDPQPSSSQNDTNANIYINSDSGIYNEI